MTSPIKYMKEFYILNERQILLATVIAATTATVVISTCLRPKNVFIMDKELTEKLYQKI